MPSLYFLLMDLGRAGFTIPFVLGRVCGGLLCWENLPLIDKCGRRAFLLAGHRTLIIALAAICVLHFHSSPPFGDTRDPTADGIFAAVCVYFSLLQQRHVKLVSSSCFPHRISPTHTMDYGHSWGPTPCLLGAETFPLR